MKIINRTPHDIRIIGKDKNGFATSPFPTAKEITRTWPKGKSDWVLSETHEPIRLNSTQVKVGEVRDMVGVTFDVKQVVYGESNLPDYEEGVYHIVSALVANAYPERKDLLMVNETIRGDDGRIIGCKSFAVVDWSDKE